MTFAAEELKLPDNPSYKRYADLKRKAVVWNVVAAPGIVVEAQNLVLSGGGLRGLPGLFFRSRGQTGSRRA